MALLQPAAGGIPNAEIKPAMGNRALGPTHKIEFTATAIRNGHHRRNRLVSEILAAINFDRNADLGQTKSGRQSQ